MRKHTETFIYYEVHIGIMKHGTTKEIIMDGSVGITSKYLKIMLDDLFSDIGENTDVEAKICVRVLKEWE